MLHFDSYPVDHITQLWDFLFRIEANELERALERNHSISSERNQFFWLNLPLQTRKCVVVVFEKTADAHAVHISNQASLTQTSSASGPAPMSLQITKNLNAWLFRSFHNHIDGS
jgi:hypothetical protein